MHAVVVNVKLPSGRSIEEGRRQLESEVLPMVRQNPGLVHAYWLAPADGDRGLSITLFETEENAQAAASRIRTPEGIELLSVEVREVVASL